MRMKMLLHTCCAPCSIQCVEVLRNQGIEPVAFWFNPNIHPLLEYRSRKLTLIDYAKSIGMELILQDEYGLRQFVKGACADLDSRCEFCYHMRMDAVASCASQNGFDCFSTTLLISPYQNHELIRSVAETAAIKHGVEFIYRDFRPHFRTGQQRARELGLYMQKYCGCIFSEEERYSKAKENNMSGR